MKWEGQRESKNIEDRRGQQAPEQRQAMGTGLSGLGMLLLTRGGRRGFLILVVVFIGLMLFGFNPIRFLFVDGALERTGQQQTETKPATAQEKTKRDKFIATVLGGTEDTWGQLFKEAGKTYRDPILVQFSGTVRSACGLASAASGPFYCPADQKLYLDSSFFDQLSRQFGAPGEFAQAYVIAHEVGHHVQNLLGILGEANSTRQRVSAAQSNAISVRIELQADCFAGMWAHYTKQEGLLESGDIEAAINAAHKIGDDTLQKQSQGYVVPDSFTHGTSAQRAKWFKLGYEKGSVKACDTFSGDI